MGQRPGLAMAMREVGEPETEDGPTKVDTVSVGAEETKKKREQTSSSSSADMAGPSLPGHSVDHASGTRVTALLAVS